MRKPKAANIPVVGSNARVTGDDLLSYVGSDDVKAGEMMSILQDATAQAQGALDVVLRHLVGESYQPQGEAWKQYGAQMA